MANSIAIYLRHLETSDENFGCTRNCTDRVCWCTCSTEWRRTGWGECTLQRSAEPGLVDTTMEGQVTFTRIVAISANQHASISCCDCWLLIAHVRPPRGLRHLIPICQTVYRSWEVVNFCFVTCTKQRSFKISRIKHSGTCFYHYVFISNRIKWLWWRFWFQKGAVTKIK